MAIHIGGDGVFDSLVQLRLSSAEGIRGTVVVRGTGWTGRVGAARRAGNAGDQDGVGSRRREAGRHTRRRGTREYLIGGTEGKGEKGTRGGGVLK